MVGKDLTSKEREEILSLNKEAYFFYDFEDCVIRLTSGGEVYCKFKGEEEFLTYFNKSNVCYEAFLNGVLISKNQYDTY